MGAQKEYQKLISERINDMQIKLIVDWLRDLKRKPAENAFTEGPARQLGYAIEHALKMARETCAEPPSVKWPDVAQCPQCGFRQYQDEIDAMTTSSVYGAIALGINAIKTQHCQPPAYKPAQDVRGKIACTRCRGTLNFTVLASNGRTTGRCTTGGCLNWRE